MPRLYGSGMHRPDRDFMHAVAADADESVIVAVFCKHGRGRMIALQRAVGIAPGGVPQPGPPVCRIGIQTEQIARGALHALRGIENGRQVRIVRRVRGQGAAQPQHAIAFGQRQVERVACTPVALVRAPQRGQAPALVFHRLADIRQRLRVGLGLPYRYGAVQFGQLQRQTVKRHGASSLHPISFAASWYQSTR